MPTTSSGEQMRIEEPVAEARAVRPERWTYMSAVRGRW